MAASDPTLGTAADYTTKPFRDWTLRDAQAAVADTLAALPGGDGSTKTAYDESAAFVEDHDHWQDGQGWVGPGRDAFGRLAAATANAIQRQFTPVDAIGEALDNVVNAVLAREAAVDFTPVDAPPPLPENATDAQRAEDARQRAAIQAKADAMREAVSGWWDRKDLWARARLAVRRSRWATRGALRCWIAPASLVRPSLEIPTTDPNADPAAPAPRPQLPAGLAFADALARVELSAPAPDAALVYTQPDTQRKVAIFLFRQAARASAAATQGATAGQTEQVAELWFLDETPADPTNPETVFRIVRDATAQGSDDAAEEYRLAIGGRLPLNEMTAPLLVTESVKRQQKRLNMTESMFVRVLETAGFPERYLTNAKPNGIWMKTRPTDGPPLDTWQDEQGTAWYLTAAPRTLGAATTTELVGITTATAPSATNPTGTEATNLATPGVTFKEPTDPQYLVTGAEHARATILRQCKQGHLVTADGAQLSGVAYEQARAAFGHDLANTRGPLETMLREVIGAAIATADLMTADTDPLKGFLDRYRVVVTARVDAGPVSPEQQQQTAQRVKDGQLSRESGLAANGVEDVAAEVRAIDTSPQGQLALAKAQGEAIKALTDAGASLEGAAAYLGIPAERVKLLVGGTNPTNPKSGDGGGPPSVGQ